MNSKLNMGCLNGNNKDFKRIVDCTPPAAILIFLFSSSPVLAAANSEAVSYTHLDVYKRQLQRLE